MRTAVSVTALLLIVAACSSTSTDTSPTSSSSVPSSSSSTATAPLSAQASAFSDTACPAPNIPGLPAYDYPPTVRCGFLTVPENRDRRGGRTIRIFVARAPAVSATPSADPLVLLDGGPGGAGSVSYAAMLEQGVNAHRELIFVDQRGAYHSEPHLGCPEYDRYINQAVSIPFSSDEATAGDIASVKDCRDQLAASGVDLSAYNTAENAADIADLRVALGLDAWDVYGVSYGSKLASVLLRDHPQGIRSVVLDSVSPPNLNIVEDWWAAPASSFAAIFAACAAQPTCAAAYPNLENDFFDTVNRLTSTPAVVQTTDSAGAPLTVNVDGYAFVYAVIMATERGDASGVPEMIEKTARGDYGRIAAATVALLTPEPIVGFGGYGLAFGVFCSESADLTTEQATFARAKSLLPRFPDQVLKLQPKQGRLFTECPMWNVTAAVPSMLKPVVSDVPVLVVSGNFDAATAPQWVDLLKPGLPASQVVPFPFTGHAVLVQSPCALAVMNSFLDDPTRPVDSSCTASIKLTFTTG